MGSPDAAGPWSCGGELDYHVFSPTMRKLNTNLQKWLVEKLEFKHQCPPKTGLCKADSKLGKAVKVSTSGAGGKR